MKEIIINIPSPFPGSKSVTLGSLMLQEMIPKFNLSLIFMSTMGLDRACSTFFSVLSMGQG